MAPDIGLDVGTRIVRKVVSQVDGIRRGMEQMALDQTGSLPGKVRSTEGRNSVRYYGVAAAIPKKGECPCNDALSLK
jgi:hypothetical protein